MQRRKLWIPLGLLLATVGAAGAFCAEAAAEERPAAEAPAAKKIELPKPREAAGVDLLKAIRGRHSTREFDTAKAIPDDVLATVLWAAGGVNRPDGKLTVPTAMNVRQMRLYVCRADGSWRYEPGTGALLQVSPDDLRPRVGRQKFMAEAPAVLVIVADLNAFEARAPRADAARRREWSQASAGCMAQNVHLAAEAFGLGTVMAAGLSADEVTRDLALKAGEEPLYIMPLGYLKKAVGPEFHPVNHASFVMETPEGVIYVDPVGKPEAYARFKPPDLILITHSHGDHYAPELLGRLRREGLTLLAPQDVTDKLGWGTVLANGESKTVKGIAVEAVAAYNTTKERLQFHPKGVGNGYVVTAGGERTYISGDTEDIPEMRALRNIDCAFVCMNLPYTMTVEQAASAVLEMKPKVAIPYHYRGKPDVSDLERFRQLVSAGRGIEVRLLKWYE
jgi:L-ascorbate metabolism protein UlaG (beta-lactamase superfamily)